jgi:hypothetical protein
MWGSTWFHSLTIVAACVVLAKFLEADSQYAPRIFAMCHVVVEAGPKVVIGIACSTPKFAGAMM